MHTAFALFDPFKHIVPARMHPVGIQHELGIERIKALKDNVDAPLTRLETAELLRMVVVHQVDPIVRKLFGQHVELFDKGVVAFFRIPVFNWDRADHRRRAAEVVDLLYQCVEVVAHTV